MPIYEYQCQECGHELEAIQRLADDPLTESPACGKQCLKYNHYSTWKCSAILTNPQDIMRWLDEHNAL